MAFTRIRLASIDAPEKDQPYGIEATLLLRRLLQNKTVLAHVQDTDKYGRKIAYIYFPKITSHSEQANCVTSILSHTNPNLLSVNCYLLTAGAAWHYKAFDKTSAKYDLHYALEQEARANKRGLWVQANPIAPWLWRKISTKVKHIL